MWQSPLWFITTGPLQQTKRITEGPSDSLSKRETILRHQKMHRPDDTVDLNDEIHSVIGWLIAAGYWLIATRESDYAVERRKKRAAL